MHDKNTLPPVDVSDDAPDSLTPARLRHIMMEVLDRVIADVFPGSQECGFINPQRFATVVVEMDDGEKLRGVVYLEEPVE